MSVISFRFRSELQQYPIHFDGPSLSVFDLKREILQTRRLKGDFDISILNTQSEQEYTDDLEHVPRNSSVVVIRQPPSVKGRGNVQRYLNATGPNVRGSVAVTGTAGATATSSANRTFERAQGGVFGELDTKDSLPGLGPLKQANNNVEETNNVENSEQVLPDAPQGDEDLDAFFAKEQDQWTKTQEDLSSRRYVFANRGGGRGGGGGVGRGTGVATPNEPDAHKPAAWGDPALLQRPPPDSYVCFRCSQKGHWIQNCPTIGNKDFDAVPRLKRTTGIPKTLLQVVQSRDAAAGAGGVMVTASGDLVVSRPNERAFQAAVARARPLVDIEALWDDAPVPKEMACPLCKKLIRDAVSVPCCGKSYCDDHIREYLLNEAHYLTCPNCKEEPISPDKLLINRVLRQATEQHVRKYADEKDKGKPATQESKPESKPLLVGDLDDDLEDDRKRGDKRQRDRDSYGDRNSKRPRY